MEREKRLPIRLNIDESFYKEEIRNGYTVKREIKELWAVSLDLLSELDRVCRENNIRYFVAYGTLLGTIRHKGFIPWDDDLDVVMDRPEYEKLCKIAGTVFNHPYFFQTEHTDYGMTRDFGRLRNSNTTSIQSYEKSPNITYNQGIFIDIFPLDAMPEEETARKNYGRKLLSLRQNAIRFSEWSIRYVPHERGSKLRRVVGPVLNRLTRMTHIPNPFFKRFEKLARKYNGSGSDCFTSIWFYDPDHEAYLYSRKDFENVEYKPFEMLMVPVPSGYRDILRASYGDWETPVMADNWHGELLVDPYTPYKEQYKQKK